MIKTVSTRGVEFVEDHEGVVLRAYICPAGVLTIGAGFTMRSKVFAAYWKGKHGHALRKGDTITVAESRKILELILNEEYGAAVAKKVRPVLQQHFDGASSMALNCGNGSLDWKWAKALAAGNIAEAASLLRTTGTTANGRTLAGLVRRRKEEAELIMSGDYTIGKVQPSAISQTTEEIMEYQEQLKALGYYIGNIDGVKGSGTRKAIERFQGENDLNVDGNVGPATRAALIRALDVKKSGTASAGSGAAAGTGSAGVEAISSDGFNWVQTGLIFAGVVLAVAIGFYIYRNRAKLLGLDRVPT